MAAMAMRKCRGSPRMTPARPRRKIGEALLRWPTRDKRRPRREGARGPGPVRYADAGPEQEHQAHRVKENAEARGDSARVSEMRVGDTA